MMIIIYAELLRIQNTENRIQVIIIYAELLRIQNLEFGHDDQYLCRIAQNTEFGDNGVGLSHQRSFHSESLEPFLLTTQINSQTLDFVHKTLDVGGDCQGALKTNKIKEFAKT